MPRSRGLSPLACIAAALPFRVARLLFPFRPVRAILFKLVHGEAPDVGQMTRKVREMLEGAIQADGVEELFETGKPIQVDIFSEEYLARIGRLQLPNTKVKILQYLLSQAIAGMSMANKMKGKEFAERLRQIVDAYNNRRKDASLANEVLDDIAEQLTDLLH